MPPLPHPRPVPPSQTTPAAPDHRGRPPRLGSSTIVPDNSHRIVQTECSMLKQFLKRRAQTFASYVAPKLWQYTHNRLLVLMYHRILPPKDARIVNEQPGMIVQPDTLRMHLRILREHFEIVPLEQWLDRAASGLPLPKNACALTFDDGWRDNFEYAYPILLQEQAPATIFVVSDMVGTNQSFWPERLADMLRYGIDRHGTDLFTLPNFGWLRELNISLPSSTQDLTVDQLDTIITTCKRYSDLTLRERLDRMAETLAFSEYRQELALVEWHELQKMIDSRLITVGSHTRRHTRLLPHLGSEILHDEIVGSKMIIEKQMGIEVRLFCYPNGDSSPEAHALVAQHYMGACSTKHGWHRRDANVHMIRRTGIHQDIAHDETSFLARLSGLL